ncbi:MAG: 50S ribosomal protein L4 [Flavobacteriales bacterium]|jgi:large subunit ribosomal protein L4|nr:50S ribosomal protein L4 [Crocinitomicaceae bacterium]MBL6593543.1 50S ribosomal protein L4 [Flavobacteriales bacterium]MBL6868709.1 50S ribosomal protein L4 [Flavobacteriales bacterium]MDC0520539.1 50S ribosomal protein L4 [Flavobacteriales bacterium]|tara:strand:- start:9920 stop:10549 length:630 start_codon:yes stop_codon:yes gene_type:complete
MEIKVLNKEGKATAKKVSLTKEIFAIEPNDHAIYLDVKQYLANQRQGTHQSRERGDIAGSTRKIKKQKGTGTARAGSIKNPLFRGGGRVFGPRPKSYSFKLNKKLKVLARKSALTYKAKEDSILVLDDLSFKTPKTKDFISVLKNLKIDGDKSLFVTSEKDQNTFLSSRNLKNAKVITADKLNTYDILYSHKLIISENAFDQIEKLFKV